MMQVLLLIDCDSCRKLFSYSRLASTDPTAWMVHGDTLLRMAKKEGWTTSICGNFHYCSTCEEELLNMQRTLQDLSSQP